MQLTKYIFSTFKNIPEKLSFAYRFYVLCLYYFCMSRESNMIFAMISSFALIINVFEYKNQKAK